MGNAAQAFERIRADLVVLKTFRCPPVTRFARVRDDLLKVETRAAQRAAFRAGAEGFFERAFAAPDYEELATKVDRATDPASLATNLLRALNRSRRETLHTQALAGLLDPARCEYGDLLLRVLLEELQPGLVDGAALNYTSVLVEHAIDLPRKGYVARPRPDITLELRMQEKADPHRVVVIENKIDAIDRDGQLDDYAQAMTLRYPQATLHLVYLTIFGSEPTQKLESAWQCFSYKSLALMLRRQLAIFDLRDGASHGWREILRLYLATIVQDLLRWSIFDQKSRASRWRARGYLQAAAKSVNDA